MKNECVIDGNSVLEVALTNKNEMALQYPSNIQFLEKTPK